MALSIRKDLGSKPKLDSKKYKLPKFLTLRILEEKYGIKACRLTLQKYLKQFNVKS